MEKGYKAFNKDETNRYGKKYEENTVYKAEGPLQFGNHGNGFHYAKRLEDTLRYFPAMEEEIQIAEVTSLGEQIEHEDDYYGYYDLFVARELRIDRFLERNEIIKMYLNLNQEDRVIRFVASYKLTPEEIEMFKLRYGESVKIIKALEYYQEGNKEAYNMVSDVKVRIKKVEHK